MWQHGFPLARQQLRLVISDVTRLPGVVGGSSVPYLERIPRESPLGAAVFVSPLKGLGPQAPIWEMAGLGR